MKLNYEELEAKCAALAEENAGLKAFKTAVYQQMGAGCEAPEFSITEGLRNLRRFADTLHAIEREFFTKEVPDEEYEGETVEECPLTWGMSVEQYVAEFRKCLAEVRAQGVKSLSNAVQSVISERQRQQSVEGWTPEHDDEHTEGEMAEAAACYAMFANNQGFSVPGLWPWAREWWKQSGQRRDLVKAGALILAEIERIDRQESAQ